MPTAKRALYFKFCFFRWAFSGRGKLACARSWNILPSSSFVLGGSKLQTSFLLLLLWINLPLFFSNGRKGGGGGINNQRREGEGRTWFPIFFHGGGRFGSSPPLPPLPKPFWPTSSLMALFPSLPPSLLPLTPSYCQLMKVINKFSLPFL